MILFVSFSLSLSLAASASESESTPVSEFLADFDLAGFRRVVVLRAPRAQEPLRVSAIGRLADLVTKPRESFGPYPSP